MKKLIYLVMLVCLISSICAFEIKAEVNNDVIIPNLNQPGEMSVKVSNAEEGYYNIYTFAGLLLDPSTAIHLDSGDNELKIKILPLDGLKARGFYIFTYTLKKGDEEKSENILIKVYDLKDILEINSNSNDPSSGKMNFYIKNKENIKLTNLNATFSSIFFNIEKIINLEPYEELEISVEVDKEKIKKINAGLYSIKSEFEIEKGSEIINGKIYLGEKKGVSTQEDSSGFVIRTKIINKINTGNVNEFVTVEVKKDIFTRFFTSFNNEPNLVDREGLLVRYVWNKELGPAEVFSVKTKTNYIYPLLIFALAAGFLYVFRKYSETDVIARKTTTPVRTKGGEFALKVKLNIKAKKDIENVSIIDRVPHMVKILDRFAGLKPSKIDVANRRLHWNVGDLSNGEERTYSYIVYSKVGVVGKFSLPEATVVFETSGEIHEVESNKVYFLTEQQDKEQ